MQSEVFESEKIVSAVEAAKQNQPVADQVLKLTPDEAVAMLEKEEKLTLAFLNKLSAAIYYPDPKSQANPRLPQKLVDKLVECCDAASWGDEAKSQFSDALTYPMRGIYQFNAMTSVPALLALLKQFSLSETMKKMCFLQTPAESVRNYASFIQPHFRHGRVTTASGTTLFTFEDYDKPRSELCKKAIPFIERCGTLARGMDKDQSEDLLRLLINDKTLHPRIPDLIWQPTTSDAALDGYIEPYLEVMLDPKADPELKKTLSPFGGVLMERMDRKQFSELTGSLNATQRSDELQAMLMKCREGKKLKPEIIDVLVSLFAEVSKTDSALHNALFPEAFAHLCGQLVPAMSEEQRRTVLSDPRVQISVPMIQALTNPAPLALSSECLRILVLRSAVQCRRALDQLIKVFKGQNNVGCIVSMFTEDVKDPENGAKLKDILLKDYFLKFLDLLVGPGVSVTDLLESVLDASDNDAQLEQVILALVNGCKHKEFGARYVAVTKQLFENPKLLDRLFKLKGKERLFTNVVDSFTDLDQEILKPIFDHIFEKGDLNEPLIQLLTVFTGKRVVLLNTNDMNKNAFNRCYHEQNVAHLLQRASTIPAYKDYILLIGYKFIIFCCRNSSAKSVAVLKLYLDFECRPSPRDCEGAEVERNLDNAFHLAAIQRNIPMLLLLFPYLKRVGKVMLELMINVRGISAAFSKEAFDLVFNAALEKDPDFIKKGVFRVNYTDFGFPFDAKKARPMLEACLGMIDAGFEPTDAELRYMAPYIAEQDLDFRLKFARTLCAKALNSYLLVLKGFYEEGKTEQLSAFMPRELFPSASDEKGAAFNYDELYEKKGLVPFENYGEAFITAVEAGLGVERKPEPAPLKAAETAPERTVSVVKKPAAAPEPQFFGGSCNVGLLAKAPRKKEVLAARSPSKDAAQSPKAVVQGTGSFVNNAAPQPPATAPQFFGGNGDESVARVPLKKAVLGPRSPVKAVTQPKEATELVFGGGELPRLLPPLKKAVLVPRSPAKKPSAEEDKASSKMDSRPK